MKNSYTIGGLAHICVYTNDMEQSLAFYTGVLRFTIDYRTVLGGDVPTDGFWPLKYALVRQGSCVVELLEPADPSRVAIGVKGSVEHFGLLVDNLEAAVDDLRARGIVFDGQIGSVPGLLDGFKSIFLKGSSGESIELCEISGQGGAP
jgi:catechol 2,3-dioxygenase-like lactoylglutathione lyase family enzyme